MFTEIWKRGSVSEESCFFWGRVDLCLLRSWFADIICSFKLLRNIFLPITIMLQSMNLIWYKHSNILLILNRLNFDTLKFLCLKCCRKFNLKKNKTLFVLENCNATILRMWYEQCNHSVEILILNCSNSDQWPK